MSFIGYIGLYWFSGIVWAYRLATPLWKVCERGLKDSRCTLLHPCLYLKHNRVLQSLLFLCLYPHDITISLVWLSYQDNFATIKHTWLSVAHENWFYKYPFKGKWSTRGVCDPSDLSFIGVKGQIGIQLSVERLNPVTKVTFCATRMTRVTSVNTDLILYYTLTFILCMEKGTCSFLSSVLMFYSVHLN